MPKAKNDYIEKTAKIIFKNSRNTINTFSKTYSGASQIYTKSLILQLKQNLPNTKYYEANGRVKRDLSIETDICILRGYYKKRRSTFVNRKAVSTKSKYSVNHTDIDTIDEFKYDSSACGDSKGSVKVENAHFNINITSLVIQNLKKLLNEWVEKYLLDNDDTKEKIETVLDSVLHRLDLQRTDTLSSCTYTVDIEVIDQKQNQISHRVAMKSQATRQGSLSVPLSRKGFRILSTLSVPKNMNRAKISKGSLNSLNKIRYKKILLSTNGSSKYLLTSSSINFLTIPTKFLTKRCATYKQHIPQENQNHNVFVEPNELNDVENSHSLSPNPRNSTLSTVPSIYKNMYKDFRYKELYSSATNNRSKKNLHEQGNSEPLVSIDFLNQSFNCVNNNQTIQEKEEKSRGIEANFDKNVKKPSRKSKKSVSRAHKRAKSKKNSYFFKRSKNYSQREKDMLYHFQSILKLISSHKCGKDIKLDIHVNVYPSNENKTEKEDVNTCEYPLISANINISDNSKVMNNEPIPLDHNIIPILDGAASQRYLFSEKTETVSSEIYNRKDVINNNNSANSSKIAQEISELKAIIESLASTTEKFITEHLTKRSTHEEVTNLNSNNTKNVDITNCVEIFKDVRPSVGVQFSNKCVKDDILGSGIKLKKDPKKKHREYNPRLVKRSISYNIIESESILKVTDMTSAVQDEVNINNRVDRALTCSLPKTKSLFEISCGKCDQKLSAIYCNNLTKPREYIYNVYERKNNPYAGDNDSFPTVTLPYDEAKTKAETKSQRHKLGESGDNETLSSTVCIDMEAKTHTKKISIRPRSGIRFCEGCCYCIFLWIPVVAILCLFHEYVLKDFLPEEYSIRRLWSKREHVNESYLRLTLADLGF